MTRSCLSISLSGIALLLLGACTPSAPPAPPSSPPVILVSFDTCRADVFGTLSGELPSLTPHLDELAADSVVFEDAFVQMPHTLPSHMSMLTSLYPDAHGVKPHRSPLPESVVTLPQLLRETGYRTVGLVTSEWLKPDFGFGRGFDHYERLPHRATYAERVNAEALEHLEPRREPLFLFLHYYDLHSDFDLGWMRNKFPYYAPPAYREGLDVSSDGEEFCDAEGNCNTGYLLAANREQRQLPRSEVETIHALYRAAVPHLDSQMGSFFDELKRRGLYDRSLIVITSDHGEEFREHGRFIHSQPYDEAIGVPLLIKFPGSWKAGTRVSEVVETVDILPTLLGYLGITPPEHVQGRSLLPLIDGPAGHQKEAVLSQDSSNRSRYGLRTKNLKLIVDLKTSRRELYDLHRDPGEQRNVAAERVEVADRLEARLEHLVRTNRRLNRTFVSGEVTHGDPLSTEERKRLEALGYTN